MDRARAQSAMKGGDARTAAALFDRLRASPVAWWSDRVLGALANLKAGRFPQARSALEEARRLRPENRFVKRILKEKSWLDDE